MDACGSAAWMCGKALPFREAPRIVRGFASESVGSRHSLMTDVESAGKALPFRTSGGEAALQDLEPWRHFHWSWK